MRLAVFRCHESPGNGAPIAPSSAPATFRFLHSRFGICASMLGSDKLSADRASESASFSLGHPILLIETPNDGVIR